jgi:hypothetical protein
MESAKHFSHSAMLQVEQANLLLFALFWALQYAI